MQACRLSGFSGYRHGNEWDSIFNLTSQRRLIHNLLHWEVTVQCRQSWMVCEGLYISYYTQTICQLPIDCCSKVGIFWNYWINWWENIRGYELRTIAYYMNVCVLFDLPSAAIEQKGKIELLHNCILYTTYKIYWEIT